MNLRHVALLTASSVPLALATWAFWWEPRSLGVVETLVPIAGWEGAPVRVALLADLHVGAPHMDLEHLAAVVDATNAARPDLILLLGDFCINGVVGGEVVPPERWAPELARLEAPLGTWAVLGNHDWWNDGPAVAAAMEAAGVPVLENRAVDLGDFWLVGVGDQTTGHDDPERALYEVPDGVDVLAMTHTPDVFDALDRRVDLLVAGHSHGGQVDLPLLGTPAAPGPYVRGHYHREGRDLFVSTGVGTSMLPVRFRVPPEVALVTIEAAGPAPTARR